MVSAMSPEGATVKLTALFCALPLPRHVDEMKRPDVIEDAAGIDRTWKMIYTDSHYGT